MLYKNPTTLSNDPTQPKSLLLTESYLMVLHTRFTNFLLRCRETSDFLKPSSVKSRFASRMAEGRSTALGPNLKLLIDSTSLSSSSGGDTAFARLAALSVSCNSLSSSTSFSDCKHHLTNIDHSGTTLESNL